MIKVFTKVYCVNKGKVKPLTVGKQYQVTRLQNGNHMDSNIPLGGMWVINDNNVEHYYSSKRFVSVAKYRERVLNEILS